MYTKGTCTGCDHKSQNTQWTATLHNSILLTSVLLTRFLHYYDITVKIS